MSSGYEFSLAYSKVRLSFGKQLKDTGANVGIQIYKLNAFSRLAHISL